MDQEKIQLLLNIQADLEVLKNVLQQFHTLGATAKKSAAEADALGEALRNATERHAKEIQQVNAELAKLSSASNAAAQATARLNTENARLTQTTTRLSAEVSRLDLRVEGAENSIAAWQAENRRLSAEVERLRGHLASATTGLVRLSDAQKQAAASARQNARSQHEQAESANQSGAAFLGLQAIMASAVTYAAVRMGKSLVDAELEMQRVKMGLLASQGSAEAAGFAFGHVSGEADRLGMSLSGVLKPFTSFAIAASVSGLEADQAREIFTQFSEAGAVMSLSGEEMEGVFRALSQMLSKGTVAAEELRGQLGERLPGAFEMSARAMGVSTKELGKMLEQGQVLSRDLLPKLGAQLQKEFGHLVPEAGATLRAELGRLDNELLKFKEAINDAGFADEFAEAIVGLTGLIKDMTEFAKENPEAIQSMGRALAAIAFGVVTAGAVASVAALGIWITTASAATLAATSLAMTAGALGAAVALTSMTVNRAVEAYGEMVDAQLELEAYNPKIITGLIERVQAMKSEEDALHARTAAVVQLNAAMKGDDKDHIARVQSIIDLIDNRSAIIIADNQREAERLEILRQQTEELEKQKAEIDRRVGLADKTAKQYEPLRFASLSPDDQLNELRERLRLVHEEMLKPFSMNASTSEEIEAGFKAYKQKEQELFIAKAEIEKRMSDIRKKTEDEYEKHVFRRMSAEQQLVTLSDKLADTNFEIAAAFGTEREDSLRTKELLVQKAELEDQILKIKEDQRKADLKQFELGAKEFERLMAESIEKQKQNAEKEKRNRLIEEELELARRLASTEEAASRIESSSFFTDIEKKRLTNSLLADQNKLLSDRIELLEDQQRLTPDPTRQGQIDELRNQRGANEVTIANNNPFTVGEGGVSGIIDYLNTIPEAAERARESMMGIAQAMENGIATSLEGLINRTMTWTDALLNVGRSVIQEIVNSFIRMAAQWITQQIVMAVFGNAIRAAQLAALLPITAAMTAMWLPAATAASIATLGGAAATGTVAARTAIIASAAGFSEGGYTGPGGKDEPAGIVHRGEVVFSQRDVARFGGVEAVEALRVSGGGFPTMASIAAAPPVVQSSEAPASAGGSTINLAMFDGRLSAEKWANSSEGESHIVDVVRRNIHRITGQA